VVKYDAAVEQDAFDIVKQLQKKHGVDHLDIVVANAGIVKSYPLVKEVKRAKILEHLEVNVFGVVSLYQATRDLLQKSLNKPNFAPVGSGAGALGSVKKKERKKERKILMGLLKLIMAWQASTSGTECFVRSIQVLGELVRG